MEERRAHRRFSLALEVKYHLQGWGEQFTCLTKNIGGGGVCLILDADLKDRTPLRLFFPPPCPDDQEGLALRGEKVWSREVSTDGNPDVSLPSDQLPPWKSPYAEPFDAGVKQIFEVGVQFIGADSPMVIKLLRYISASVGKKV